LLSPLSLNGQDCDRILRRGTTKPTLRITFFPKLKQCCVVKKLALTVQHPISPPYCLSLTPIVRFYVEFPSTYLPNFHPQCQRQASSRHWICMTAKRQLASSVCCCHFPFSYTISLAWLWYNGETSGQKRSTASQLDETPYCFRERTPTHHQNRAPRG
jgi:hypothetical protein